MSSPPPIQALMLNKAGYSSVAWAMWFQSVSAGRAYVATVQVVSPLSGDGSTTTPISIPPASDLVPGYLTATDHQFFAAKVSFPGFGTTSLLACVGNDVRLSDARIPLAHNQAVSTISDSTAIGQNLVKLVNPSAITFLRCNANNTVDTLTAGNFRIAIGAGVGTVTSVGLALPSEITVTNSPVSGSGTLTGTWAVQAANTALMGPATGSAATPSFRRPSSSDLSDGASVMIAPSVSYTFTALVGQSWQAGNDSSIGTEMITDQVNRDFSGAGDWSTGTATWSISGGAWLHSAAANATSLAIAKMTAAPVVGGVYKIEITIVTSTPGTLIISYGGVSATTIGQVNGTLTTYTVTIIPNSTTSPLTVTPDAAWIGSIDNISVMRITPSAPVLTVKNAAGTTCSEMRAINSSSFAYGVNAARTATGTGNTGFGASSLRSLMTGTSNTAVGNASLRGVTTGGSNCGIGMNSLIQLTVGGFNTAVGSALNTLVTGSNNVGLGVNAAYYCVNGSNNVNVGYCSGMGVLGSGNVTLGYYAGTYETGSNAFYVDNQDRTNTAGDKAKALLYGVFDAAAANQTLAINGKVGIAMVPSTYYLQIATDSAGKPGVGGLWAVVSDERIKEGIELANLDRCYDIVRSIPLKRFRFRADCYSDAQIRDRGVLGWIAQDVQPIFPRAVNKHKFVQSPAIMEGDQTIQEERVIEDCLDLDSGQINAALYGAVQKMQTIIEKLQARLDILDTTKGENHGRH